MKETKVVGNAELLFLQDKWKEGRPVLPRQLNRLMYKSVLPTNISLCELNEPYDVYKMHVDWLPKTLKRNCTVGDIICYNYTNKRFSEVFILVNPDTYKGSDKYHKLTRGTGERDMRCTLALLPLGVHSGFQNVWHK